VARRIEKSRTDKPEPGLRSLEPGPNNGRSKRSGAYLRQRHAAAPFTAYAVDQRLRSPYVQNFSLNVQRQLTSNVLFQVGYVGSQGRKLIVDRNINLPPPSPTAYTDFQAARPFNNDFPNLAGITQISSIGDSNYNSLQTLVRSTSWHGLSDNWLTPGATPR